MTGVTHGRVIDWQYTMEHPGTGITITKQYLIQLDTKASPGAQKFCAEGDSGASLVKVPDNTLVGIVVGIPGNSPTWGIATKALGTFNVLGVSLAK